MRKATINECEFYLPDNWNELSDADLFAIAELISVNEGEGTICLELLLRNIPFTVGDRERNYIKGEQAYLLVPTDAASNEDVLMPLSALTILATQAFNWLFKDEFLPEQKDFVFRVNSKLTRSPFAGDIEFPFIGPRDGLTNAIFDEYILANTVLDDYRTSPTDTNLNRFCAVLWRPKRIGEDHELLKLGDDREEFNDFVVEKAADDWKSIPAGYKLPMLWYYMGCLQALKQFKSLGAKAEASNEPLYLASSKLVDALADGDVTKLKEVRKAYLYEVLLHLDRMIEQKEEFENNKPK